MIFTAQYNKTILRGENQARFLVLALRPIPIGNREGFIGNVFRFIGNLSEISGAISDRFPMWPVLLLTDPKNSHSRIETKIILHGCFTQCAD